MSELDQVRATIAREAGLDDRAAAFVQGDSVEAIEESAASLAKLLGERADREATISQASDPISASLRSRAERKAALVQALHGRPQDRARDPQGRFVSASASFDGGARGDALPAASETHDQTLARVLRTGEANVGGRGF